MLEAPHYTAAAKRKGSYALPAEYEGEVNTGVLYHAVRAFRNNARQGTAATKSRSEVSGGNQKPWRQKGTGRARQGSIRAPNWVGGGVAFGPQPRSYRTDLPQKARQVARRSALRARAQTGAIHVLEQFDFAAPKTKQMADLLAALGLTGKRVLLLTAETSPNVYRSARNIPGVETSRYRDAAAYDVLRAEALVIEEAAIGGHVVAGSAKKEAPRARRARKAAAPKKPAARTTKTKKKATPKKAAGKATTKKAGTRKSRPSSGKKKGS
jgi:large subunit ribosomal protein L4